MAKNTMSDEARARINAYHREYRRKNPERARQWHENYILKKAARLQATRTISTTSSQEQAPEGVTEQGGPGVHPDD